MSDRQVLGPPLPYNTLVPLKTIVLALGDQRTIGETSTGSFQHLVLGHFDQEALNISEPSP